MDRNHRDGSDDMVFNTGAALLDAIVLAVVSMEEEGTYGYKPLRFLNRHCIRFCGVCKRMSVWKFTIWSAAAGTVDITKLRKKVLCS